MWRILLAFAITFSFAEVSSYAQGKKYALVVGVEKYDPAQLASLDYAEDDAIEVGSALEAIGFNVVVMTSQATIPDRQPVLAQDILNQLDRRLRDRDPSDTILVSLSGHGVQLKGDAAGADGTKETYFCPQRASLADRSSLLPISEVLKRISKCAATKKVLLVDACRNEVEPPDVKNKSVEIELDPAGVTRRTIPQGMVALFSCSPRERSYELGSLGHSVFSYHVKEYLRGRADPVRYPRSELSISELATYVSRETRDLVDSKLNKDQTPELLLLDRGKLSDWSLGRLEGNSNPLRSKSTGMQFVLVQPGEFLMGSPATEADRSTDEQPHRVRITQPFYMATTEVTQGQGQAVMNTTPWQGQTFVKEGSDYPATYVSWEDAVEFCRRLSAKDSRKYRLPTEAKWEYACRAGSTTMYSFGSSAASLKDYAWCFENTYDVEEKYAHRVGQKRANAFGLFDMHGNVNEWCADWYDEKYYTTPAATNPDPVGPATGSGWVHRGGGWIDAYELVRSANRTRLAPGTPSSLLGFRVASSSVE